MVARVCASLVNFIILILQTGGGGVHRVHPIGYVTDVSPNCFYILSYNYLTHFQERFTLGIQGCHCQYLFSPCKFMCPIMINITNY